MATAFIQFARRNWAIFNHPHPAKTSDALRIGLLGASNIAPQAIIAPAKSHPEVIIAAVAARDEKRAQAYAKKHGIPIVHKSYQDLLDDPSIDAIYIPLPNGLHYEWALKALAANKHVLLEKPSTSNATEAASLFHHELLKQPNPPILLEAFHPRFHPAWQMFLSLLSPQNIESAHASVMLFKGFLPNDDIRFIYSLSGGTLMNFGTYTVLALRQMLGTEPEACVEATPKLMPKGYDQNCDQAFAAKWRFPGGAMGEIEADLAARGGWPFPRITGGWPSMRLPRCAAVHREALVADDGLREGEEHVFVRTVTIWNLFAPPLWHRIDISDEHTIRSTADEKVIKSWKEVEYKKAYTWASEGDPRQPGEEYWTTYRHQLEQFVNKVRGREGSGVWMDGEDSIKQMAMIDSAYKKAGLPIRPTSSICRAFTT